ncbi:hypothetical protein LOK49_LG07G03632 [Camellia lanceoleosa]|uniref:Uncharacterized protein n=1 Tax=Camellia lanceoleosa TaxID=1840588 RepID=A0ACC0H065_9ERIC|nr:hypothetical protein LOK49_LG07G03632 [Camellia lanceoleosa]
MEPPPLYKFFITTIFGFHSLFPPIPIAPLLATAQTFPTPPLYPLHPLPSLRSSPIAVTCASLQLCNSPPLLRSALTTLVCHCDQEISRVGGVGSGRVAEEQGKSRGAEGLVKGLGGTE